MVEECDKCGDEFDSERGLHIHESQAHNKEKENNNEEQSSSTEQKVALSVKQFAGLTFATGLFLGIVIGMTLAGVPGPQEVVASPENTDNTDNGSPSPSGEQADNQQDSGSSVVELSNTEYPYGDLETGIGSENRTIDGTTFKLNGEPYIGSPDAPVTAVSYEDFECPFCAQYNNDAYPQIVENFVQTGDVQYFYKNLPLQNIHPWAEPAGLASECALNQDAEAFWIFKQGFFNNQEALGNAHNSGDFDESMYQWAEQTGLDKEQFQTCYDNEEELDEVNQDKEEAGSNGAQATPTVFINGEMLEGAQPYSRFESTIQSALEQ